MLSFMIYPSMFVTAFITFVIHSYTIFLRVLNSLPVTIKRLRIQNPPLLQCFSYKTITAINCTRFLSITSMT